MRIERVDISSVLSKALEMCSPLLEQRRHRLSMDIEHGLYLDADPMRLAQVVANLVNNAARYTDSGGHVSVAATRDANDSLKISVKDNGIGIPRERLPQIFDLFFQGERGADRAEGGLGIGLALVKNIVGLHGGSVEAKSGGKGMGSEFIVRMPMNSRLGKPGRTEHAPAMHGSAGFYKRRIMLVDDNVDAAATLAQVLAVYGHEVEVFNDPVTALAAVQRFKPEIAVLDIGLPVLDGFEVCRRIRALPGGDRVRVVALTTWGTVQDRFSGAQAGFDEHWTKPLGLELFCDLTRRQLLAAAR
jgi:CheY-like chemotaxis protein